MTAYNPPEWVFRRAQEQAWSGTPLPGVLQDLRCLGATVQDALYVLTAPAPLGYGHEEILGDYLVDAGFGRDEIIGAVHQDPPRFVQVRWDGQDRAEWVPEAWVAPEPGWNTP